MSYSYTDVHATFSQRAEDLLSKMTLSEKVAQLSCYNPKDRQGPNLENNFPDSIGSVAFLAAAWYKTPEEVRTKLNAYQRQVLSKSRLKIPALFHIETLTGVLVPGATSYPSGIGRGAAWDPVLEKKMGNSVGEQAQALGIRQAMSPVLDVSRDARFGHQNESYGEDPTLVARLGTAFTEGIQANNKVLATAKHFLGYHGGLGGIHAAQVEIPERELWEVYGKPFVAAINQGHLASLMNAYSTVNGESVLMSKHMLQDRLRKEMKFEGLLVSDYASMAELVTRLHLAADNDEAAKRVIESGFEVELPTPVLFTDRLVHLVESGKLDESLINAATRRVLIAKFKLGLFEHPFAGDNATMQSVLADNKAHNVSLNYARESLVLLKNNGILPLNPDQHQKIAIIGHHMQSMRSMFGGYTYMSVLELAMGTRNTMAGIGNESDTSGITETYPGSKIEVENPELSKQADKAYPECRNLAAEFVEKYPKIDFKYSYGYPYAGSSQAGFADALTTAEEAGLAIITVGGKVGWGTACTTGEGIDAASINLPACQEAFMNELGHRKIPFIVVHLDGRPISSNAADRYASAIIEAWSPAQYGPQAIVETIFGKNNPSGKLPVSVAYDASQMPLFYNHSNGSSYDVNTQTFFSSYIDLPHEPRYYFGYGQSYSDFSYSKLHLDDDIISPSQPLQFSIAVTNNSERKGTEIVQAYASDLVASVVRPVRALVGFTRVNLEPHATKFVHFTLAASQLALLNSEMHWVTEAGEFELQVGSSSKTLPLKAKFYLAEDCYVSRVNQEMWAPATITKG